MLVRCTYEELTALTAGAERTLEAAASGGGVGVAAPPRELADVEALLARADGDLEFTTLHDQRSVARALDLILTTLHGLMESTVLEGYVGAEEAVVAYFDYAHVLTFRERVRHAGDEMEAMIDLMSGGPATSDNARQITFGDEE